MIVPNNLNYSQVSATTQTLTGRVSSADEVIVVICADFQGGSANSLTAKFNGVNIPQASAGIQVTGLCLSVIFIVWNPPVGSYAVTLADANASVLSTTVMSLLGVSKRSQTPINANTSSASTPASLVLPVQVASANSIIIDCLTQNDATTAITPGVGQTQIMNLGDTGGNNYGSSYKFASPGLQSMSWTLTTTNTASYALVVLEPDDAPSMWYPNVQQRSRFDVAGPNNLSTGGAKGITGPNGGSGSFGFFQSTFYQNSFLHTIGRALSPGASQAIPAAETEQQTGQIIIDKIYQGQSSGGAALTLDINIPSQDAILIVTGGSVIAAGGVWLSNTINGNPLTKLIGQLTAGADAEIWWNPYPTVGVWPLVVTPTAITGEAYVNAFVLLGVDKRSINVQTLAVGDAASTTLINGTITPDAPNSLAINVLSTLNATRVPVPDASQNQMYNPVGINAGEYVMVGFQLISSPQLIEYNLGVAVNAALVVITLRPAMAPSIWNPNVDNRTLDDVVDANALDSGNTPATGRYGYKESQFYQNSFLHTIGRIPQSAASIVNANITQVGASLTFTGGTQTVASVNNSAITQVAASLTFTGGTQALATVNDVAIAQVAASLTFTGGTQALATVNDSAIAQAHATLTFTGGTQAVASVQDQAIAQVGASLTFTGGTQLIQTFSAISQSAASLTFTGGTQAIAAVRSVQIAQVAATLTFTGGTQVLTAAGTISIAQVHASLTFTGGTQSFVAQTDASVSQTHATLTFTGGTQAIASITPPNFVPLTITLVARPLVVTLNASPSSITLSDDSQLEIALTASSFNVTLSSRPLSVILQAPEMSVTLKG